MMTEVFTKNFNSHWKRIYRTKYVSVRHWFAFQFVQSSITVVPQFDFDFHDW